MNIVERFCQVVHGQVANDQDRRRTIVCFALRTGEFGGGNSGGESGVILSSKVGFIRGIGVTRDEHLEMLKLGWFTIVVWIGHQIYTHSVRIASYLEGTITTTLGKVIGPFGSILVDQLLLYHIRTCISQSLQEIGSWFADDDFDRIGIRG